MKTKTITNIENKMEELDPASLRYLALRNAKGFKTSWIELGQVLYKVWKDKVYKEWGYSEFDAYAAKEIGIRKETSLKLLRSYSFLEKEEPGYLKKDYAEKTEAGKMPTYEAVDVLRKASGSKKLDAEDYSRIKKYVLHDGKDAKEVRKDLSDMIREKQLLDPTELREKNRKAILKRFASLLRSVSGEIRAEKLLPEEILRDAEKLIKKIEEEI